MLNKSASYLTMRGSVYYFQMRLAVRDEKTRFVKYKLLRKSTRTGNKREAQRIARKWWVQIMDRYDNYEDETDREAILYRRGREISMQLSKLDENDHLEVEDYIARELGTSGHSTQFDIEALDFYQNQQNQEKETQDNAASNNSLVVEELKKLSNFHLKDTEYKLSELLVEYVTDLKTTGNKIGVKTIKKYNLLIGIMIEMVGDIRAKDLTAEHFNKAYVRKISLIPIRRNNKKKFKDANGNILNMHKCIEIATRDGDDLISESSVFDYALRVRGFVSWCNDKKYIKNDIINTLDRYRNDKDVEKTNSMSFNDEDLKKIFHSDYFVNGKHLKHLQFRHWGLLLALYSGARAGEIAQIHVSDVKKHDIKDFWYIDLVYEGENRSIKNKKTRTIPVHPDLIKLGFINFVQNQKRNKHTRLFETLKMDKDGVWHRSMSRWFNNDLREEVGIKTEQKQRKSFHSFRNTFIDKTYQLRLDREVVNEIVGHSDLTKVQRTYRNALDIVTKFATVKKIHFDIDIDKIKKYK